MSSSSPSFLHQPSSLPIRRRPPSLPESRKHRGCSCHRARWRFHLLPHRVPLGPPRLRVASTSLPVSSAHLHAAVFLARLVGTSASSSCRRFEAVGSRVLPRRPWPALRAPRHWDSGDARVIGGGAAVQETREESCRAPCATDQYHGPRRTDLPLAGVVMGPPASAPSSSCVGTSTHPTSTLASLSIYCFGTASRSAAGREGGHRANVESVLDRGRERLGKKVRRKKMTRGPVRK